MKKWLEDELNERGKTLFLRYYWLLGEGDNPFKCQMVSASCALEEEDVVLSIKECLLEDASERAEYLFNSIKWED